VRDAYHQELDAIGSDLARMARLAGAALRKASAALLGADLNVAES